jgi:hypothetical protein
VNHSPPCAFKDGAWIQSVSKQQQQQPQSGVPEHACERCGGINLLHTPIADPVNNRTMHLYRCKACDNHQWKPDDTR